MKICDLLKIHENQIFVVAHYAGNIVLREINGFDVFIDDHLKILSELFFRLNQLSDYGS
jgi:hypothetical protein